MVILEALKISAADMLQAQTNSASQYINPDDILSPIATSEVSYFECHVYKYKM